MSLASTILHLRTLGFSTRRAIIARIEEEYVRAIPETLRKIPKKRKLYGAIVPHFGWGPPTADAVTMGASIWTLAAR